MSSWFFLSPEELFKDRVILKNENLRHLRALRLKKGDFVVLSDGRGKAFQARLDVIDPQKAVAVILEEIKERVEPSLEVRLYLGISKGEKVEQVIRQAVELGARRIATVITRRTVVKLTASKGKEKARRWQKIAYSAAAQCRRSYVPEIRGPLSFEEMMGCLEKEKMVIVPWEEEREKGLYSLLKEYSPPPKEVSLFTGPEGGISPEEMNMLKRHPGVHPVTLGPRILRAETAPLALLAVIMFCWGDLG